jgi:hypothetical protein
MADLKSPCICWTIRARRQLKQALVRQEVQAATGVDQSAEMARIERILARAFENATNLIIHEQYLGFRFKKGEYILRVEVNDANRPGNYVIKINDERSLEAELEAWTRCRPDTLRHDLVFMTLDAVPDASGKPCALIYQDAHQFIGVDRTASLEEAFLASVCHGSPTPESVANIFTELFARVGHLLYRGACPVEPSGKRFFLKPNTPVEQAVQPWNEPGEPRNARRIALALQPKEMLDPVNFLEFIAHQLETGKKPKDFIPRMLRGLAHGDLHGRNILVGLVDDEAHWPAVYDYEDMARDHWVGWDFAKLETELKIRAYPLVFANRKLLDFASAVYDFETSLGEATERHRRERPWPLPAGQSAEERLRNLLLCLRKLAGHHLGDAHGRPGEWLEECYFLLGSYGVHAGKFTNLTERELAGAFMSAGVGFYRFSYSRQARMARKSKGAPR